MHVLGDLDDPISDLDRLRVVARYDVTRGDIQEELDDLARTTAEYLDRPMGLITLVLDSAQLFAGRFGLGDWLGVASGTPIEWSFCAQVVRGGVPYLVPDAHLDLLQRDNPLVTIDGIRSYAGAPIVGDDGHVIGAACVLDREPFTPTPDDVAQLQWSARRALAILRRGAPTLG